jgi:hypothetical protein
MGPRRRQYMHSQRSRASETAWRKYPQPTVRQWNGRMKCTTGHSQDDQEHKAMAETAHRLHETSSQRGESALTMMQSILKKVLPMDFKVRPEKPRGLPPRRTFTTCARRLT